MPTYTFHGSERPARFDAAFFDAESLRIAQHANLAAREFDHQCIGTHHLLFAFAMNEHASPTQMLYRNGITLEFLRSEFDRLAPRGTPAIIFKLPTTKRLWESYLHSIDLRPSSTQHVSSQMLFLGLLAKREPIVDDMLNAAKLSASHLETLVTNA